MIWKIIETAYDGGTWFVVACLWIAIGWIGLMVLMFLIALVWTAVQAIVS